MEPRRMSPDLSLWLLLIVVTVAAFVLFDIWSDR
jgi:hypothetical protein